jgi:hypothetical protein
MALKHSVFAKERTLAELRLVLPSAAILLCLAVQPDPTAK